MGFWNGQGHIWNDLKWSYHCQIGLKIPYWPLIGPDNPWETRLDYFAHLRPFQGMNRPVSMSRPFWCWEDHFSQYEYEFVYFGTPFCFPNISAPNIAQKWFSFHNVHMDLSFQKKEFRHLFLGSWDIKQIKKVNLFRRPVAWWPSLGRPPSIFELQAFLKNAAHPPSDWFQTFVNLMLANTPQVLQKLIARFMQVE